MTNYDGSDNEEDEKVQDVEPSLDVDLNDMEIFKTEVPNLSVSQI